MEIMRTLEGVGGLNTYNKDLIIRPIKGSIVPYPPKRPYGETTPRLVFTHTYTLLC